MVFRVLNNLPARLATPFRWLMVAGIAYTLATSLIYLLAGPEAAPVATPDTAADSRPARPAVDIDRLLARNLFGVAGTSSTPTEGAQTAAVATQLPLELRGVFVADGEGVSAAIIAQRGKPGVLYDVGQSIAGSATLENVAPDHVVLRRAGVAETLNFPRPGQGLARGMPVDEPAMPVDEETPVDVEPYEQIDDPAGEAPAPEDPPAEPATDEPAAAAAGPTGDAGTVVASYRERLAADPDNALASLGMSPVSTGAASGYRVGSLAQAPYLGQTGLQPGDVILSVNGRPVGDLRQDRLEIDNVLAQGSARIEVQRGERRFFVTAALP